MRILVLFYLLAVPLFAQQGVNWHKDFKAAKAIAEKSGKPILAVFR